MTHSKYPVRVPLATETWGIWKTLTAARRNVLEIIPARATKQAMVSGKMAIVRWYMLMDPGGLRRVLLENVDDYPKSIVTKSILEPAIGDSLFVAEGAHWRWQRRAASPVFSHRNVQNLAPVMTRAAERACERIIENPSDDIDMFDEMTRSTFDVIAEVTFSDDDDMDGQVVHKAIDSYIASVAKVSLMDIIGLPVWIPRPGRLLTGKALNDMKSIADASIERRKSTGPKDVPDLLDLLLDGEDPKTKRQMNTAELRDNLLTFIVAGHETTALTLGWALYLCAFDPDIQAKARVEAQAALNGRAATAHDLANLPLCRMIIDEALRLYPPAAFLARTAQQDDVICDQEVRKGDTVILPIYALHRNTMLWDDPDAFNPYRFENPKAIDRYACLPFGNGPRVCIGAQFALQEAVIILSTLLSRFTFNAISGSDPRPEMVLTLRPTGGVWLNVLPV